jgi:hypothetical protein
MIKLPFFYKKKTAHKKWPSFVFLKDRVDDEYVYVYWSWDDLRKDWVLYDVDVNLVKKEQVVNSSIARKELDYRQLALLFYSIFHKEIKA